MTHTPGLLYAIYNGHFWDVSTEDDRYAPSVGYSPEESYARLFAASPSMQHALEHVRDGKTDMNEIMAAIAKAEGRTA